MASENIDRYSVADTQRISDNLTELLQTFARYNMKIYIEEESFFYAFGRALAEQDIDKLASLIKEQKKLVTIQNQMKKNQQTTESSDNILERFLQQAQQIVTSTAQIFPQYNPYNPSDTNLSTATDSNYHIQDDYNNNNSYTYAIHQLIGQTNLKSFIDNSASYTVRLEDNNQAVLESRLFKMFRVYYWIKEVSTNYEHSINTSPALLYLIAQMKKFLETLMTTNNSKLCFDLIKEIDHVQLEFLRPSIENYKLLYYSDAKIIKLEQKINEFNKTIEEFLTGTESCDKHWKTDSVFQSLCLEYYTAQAKFIRENRLISMIEIYYWIREVNDHYQKTVKQSGPLTELIQKMRGFLAEFIPHTFKESQQDSSEPVTTQILEKLKGLLSVFTPQSSEDKRDSIEKTYAIRLQRYKIDIENYSKSDNPVKKIKKLNEKISQFTNLLDSFKNGTDLCALLMQSEPKFNSLCSTYNNARKFFIIDKNQTLDELGHSNIILDTISKDHKSPSGGSSYQAKNL